jgi:hypothetical protein
MECQTARARAALEVSLPQRSERESLGRGFLRRRAFRGNLGASGVAMDDGEVSAGSTASVAPALG